MKIRSELKFQYIKTNNINLHVVTSGNPENPLIILLHGFPEFWYSFHRQIDALVAAGYYVMLPDQRGYNLSDKPLRIGSYKISKISKDIIGLIDFTNKERAYIVGHDWGAAVAWYMAMTVPEKVLKSATLNVPHPKVMKKFLLTQWSQIKKSWYMFFYQLPVIPQLYMRKQNYRAFRGSLKTSKKGTFTPDEIKLYMQTWKQPRAVPAMLNWYRAAFRRFDRRKNNQLINPHLIIWGEDDRFLDVEMAHQSLRYCIDGSLEIIPNSTHWVQHEKPELVSKIIINFLKS